MNRLYQMYDVTAQSTYGIIVMEKHDGPAMRQFHAVLGNKEILPGQYPEQFTLLCLGLHNPDTGQIQALAEPQVIATGAQWLESQNIGKAPLSLG